jgi:hypothetical protein
VSGFEEFLESPEKYEILEEYLGFTGPHIKTLKITDRTVDPQIFQNLLNLLPNLESLELDYVKNITNENFSLDLKSLKISRLKMDDCTGLESLLEALEKCTITDLEMRFYSQTNPEAIKKFLKSQEKNLKKLTIGSGFTLADLRDLRLEYLDLSFRSQRSDILVFLRQHVDLKILKLYVLEYSEEVCNVIWEMKNLESLELTGGPRYNFGLNQLHKLEKLKRLKADRLANWNILDHMKFGVFQNLEELHAFLQDDSLESSRKISRITPNLKKLAIHSASSDTVNAVLDTLENLESLEIKEAQWEMSGKVHLKIKRLDVGCEFEFTLKTEQFTQQFPNLEYLKINCSSSEVTEPFFFKLLSGLKQLKTLYMKFDNNSLLDPEPVLQWFQRYGNHLEDAKIVFVSSDFAIEKRPRGAFCINKKDCSFYSSWMQKIF